MCCVVVSGGRPPMRIRVENIFEVLSDIHRLWTFSDLVHGGAKGVDRTCASWAALHGIPVLPFPADWDNLDGVDPSNIAVSQWGKKYNRLAGCIRNQKMIDVAAPDLAIFFPGNNGTADMLKRTIRSRIPIILVDEYGKWCYKDENLQTSN